MKVVNADCIDVMAAMDSDSIDSIVTDPPYGLSFMGKGWDHGVPGEAFWREALRVAKPGAYLLAFGGTRTYHRLAVAIEDAGWEIRDCLGWLYGTGFPKSHNISKALDKAAGAEREVIREGKRSESRPRVEGQSGEKAYRLAGDASVTAPATDSAKRYDGWGTCLKPAWEPIVMARKPLVGTVANNVLTYGTGGINIDASRVEHASAADLATSLSKNPGTSEQVTSDVYGANRPQQSVNVAGRFPTNIIHDGSAEVLELFPDSKGRGHTPSKRGAGGISCDGHSGQAHVEERDMGSGSTSRFFYCAKASKSDRGEGNTHPTVKPTSLMEYLVRMVTPEGGVVLDPFMGSGTTLVAAKRLGFEAIGIDLQGEYCDIAVSRIGGMQ